MPTLDFRYLTLGRALDEDDLRAAACALSMRTAVDAGEGLQEAALLGVGREVLVDVPVEVADALADGVVFGQQVGEQPAVGLSQGQVQRVAPTNFMPSGWLREARP